MVFTAVYDNEEIMLFKFPVTGYHDGTYITADAERRRLNDYTLETTEFTTAKDSRFSAGWKRNMSGVKEEVGLCFTELWPYIYNEPDGHDRHSNQMASVEY